MKPDDLTNLLAQYRKSSGYEGPVVLSLNPDDEAELQDALKALGSDYLVVVNAEQPRGKVTMHPPEPAP